MKQEQKEIKEPKEPGEIMNVDGVATFMGISPAMVRKLLSESDLPCHCIGSRPLLMFLKDEIISWVRSKPKHKN